MVRVLETSGLVYLRICCGFDLDEKGREGEESFKRLVGVVFSFGKGVLFWWTADTQAGVMNIPRSSTSDVKSFGSNAISSTIPVLNPILIQCNIGEISSSEYQ